MANSLASLVPILIEEESIPFLRRRGGLVKNVFSVREQTAMTRGGQTVTITMPNTPTAPANVSYTSPNAAQGVTLPSAQLTFNNHIQRKQSLTELEARIVQGNQYRILKETITGMMDDLVIAVEQDIAAYWSYFPIIGSNAVRLNDATMRAAMVSLQKNRVDPARDKVRFRGTVTQYNRDLLDLDRYVLALQQGQGIQGESEAVLMSGRIPTLYNIEADWSSAMPSQTFSGGATEIGMMFEEHALAVGFLEFQPWAVLSEGAAPVTESWTKDPESGITIRWQTYADMDTRNVFLQADVCWGSALLDATRGVAIMSATA